MNRYGIGENTGIDHIAINRCDDEDRDQGDQQLAVILGENADEGHGDVTHSRPYIGDQVSDSHHHADQEGIGNLDQRQDNGHGHADEDGIQQLTPDIADEGVPGISQNLHEVAVFPLRQDGLGRLGPIGDKALMIRHEVDGEDQAEKGGGHESRDPFSRAGGGISRPVGGVIDRLLEEGPVDMKTVHHLRHQTPDPGNRLLEIIGDNLQVLHTDRLQAIGQRGQKQGGHKEEDQKRGQNRNCHGKTARPVLAQNGDVREPPLQPVHHGREQKGHHDPEDQGL